MSDVRVVPRETVERVARIIGPSSAASRALAEADRRTGPTIFFYVGSTLFTGPDPLTAAERAMEGDR